MDGVIENQMRGNSGRSSMKIFSSKTWKKSKVKPTIAITKAIKAIRIIKLSPLIHFEGYDIFYFFMSNLIG